jgi:hypothetical protein
MTEAGFALPPHPQLLPPGAIKGAALIVTFGLPFAWLTPPDIRRESWDAEDLRAISLERLREVRDRLRERVWKLVAKEGWYRLQPARMVHHLAKVEYSRVMDARSPWPAPSASGLPDSPV